MIRGKKTVLRPFRESDLEFIRKWQQDEELAQYTGGYGWNNREVDYRRKVLIIEDLNGQVIGDLVLEQIAWRTGSAELRIRIGEKDYWNKGYGTDVLGAFLKYLFSNTRLRKVYLRVYTGNQRAIRCYEKVGFKKEALLPAGRRSSQGYKDLILMSIGRNEHRVNLDISGPGM